jgi:hypothetical protein
MMSRELAAALAVAVMAVGGCAHEAPKPSDPYVANSVAAIRTWLDGLPRCPPSKLPDETPSFRRDDGTDAIAARGKLTLASHSECTATACTTECCNTCLPRWVVVPDAADAPVHELAIQKSGASQPLSAGMKGCKVEPVRQLLPATRVSVSGFLEGETIIRASMCVIEDPPAPPVK